MDQLWGIALRAQSADISRAAIQYINSYYINGWLERVLVTPGVLRREDDAASCASLNSWEDGPGEGAGVHQEVHGESADGFGQPGGGRPVQPKQHRERPAHAQNTPGGLQAQVSGPLRRLVARGRRVCVKAASARQVCVSPASVADRGDGNQQPPEGSER